MMVFKEAFVAERAGKGCAVAAGRVRSVLHALLWTGGLAMGVLAMGVPAASAQGAGGFPGGSAFSFPEHAAASTVTVRLRCWPDRPVFKSGGPVKIHVALVNKDKVPVLIRARFDPAPVGPDDIRTPPLKISCYNPVTHFSLYFIGPTPYSLPAPPKLMRLRPGASVGAMFDLTKFYRLPPGTYNITVYYADYADLSGPSRVGKRFVITTSAKVKSADFRIVP